MEAAEIIGHCAGDGLDPISQEPLNFDTEDIVLIFKNEEFKRAECMKRDDIAHLYRDSTVMLWPPVDNGKRLIKLPFLNRWVEDGIKILRNRKISFL